MTKIRIAGPEFGTPPGTSLTADNLGGSRHTVLYSGLVTELRFYALANGNIKPSAYDDNGSDHPGDRRAFNDTGVATTSGSWTVATVSAFTVTASDWLWLNAVGDTLGALTADSSGGTLRHEPFTYSTFTSSDPCASLTNSLGWTLGSQAWGYAKPTTTSIDGDNVITVGQTNIDIAGLHFDDDTSGPTVWFTDSASWGSETIKVQQTRNSYNDTTINIDYNDPGDDLSAGTGWYVWVETGRGQVQSSGLNFEIQIDAETIGSCDMVGQTGEQSSSSVTVEIIAGCQQTGPQGSQYSQAITVELVGNCDIVGPGGEQSAESVTVELAGQCATDGPPGEQSAEITSAVQVVGQCDMTGPSGIQSSSALTVELIGDCDQIGPEGQQESSAVTVELAGQCDMVGPTGEQSASAITLSEFETIGQCDLAGLPGEQYAAAITVEMVGDCDMVGPDGSQSSSAHTVEVIGQCNQTGPDGEQSSTSVTVQTVGGCDMVGPAGESYATIITTPGERQEVQGAEPIDIILNNIAVDIVLQNRTIDVIV